MGRVELPMNRFWLGVFASLLLAAGPTVAAEGSLIVRVDWPRHAPASPATLFDARMDKFPVRRSAPPPSVVRVYWRASPAGLPPGTLLALDALDATGATRRLQKASRTALRGPQMAEFPWPTGDAEPPWRARVVAGGRVVAEASGGGWR
jgi:hypothetical protein